MIKWLWYVLVVTVIALVGVGLWVKPPTKRLTKLATAPPTAVRLAEPVGEEMTVFPPDRNQIVVEPRLGGCLGVIIPLEATAYQVDPLTDSPVWIRTWDGKISKSAIRGEKGVFLPIRRNPIKKTTIWVCGGKAAVSVERR